MNPSDSAWNPPSAPAAFVPFQPWHRHASVEVHMTSPNLAQSTHPSSYVPVNENMEYSGRSGGTTTTLRSMTPQVETRPAVGSLGTGIDCPADLLQEKRARAKAAADLPQAGTHGSVDRRHFYGQEVYGKGKGTLIVAGEDTKALSVAHGSSKDAEAKSHAGLGMDNTVASPVEEKQGQDSVPIGEHDMPVEHKGGYYGAE